MKDKWFPLLTGLGVGIAFALLFTKLFPTPPSVIYTPVNNDSINAIIEKKDSTIYLMNGEIFHLHLENAALKVQKTLLLGRIDFMSKDQLRSFADSVAWAN